MDTMVRGRGLAVAVARDRRTLRGFLGGVVVPSVRIDDCTFKRHRALKPPPGPWRPAVPLGRPPLATSTAPPLAPLAPLAPSTAPPLAPLAPVTVGPAG